MGLRILAAAILALIAPAVAQATDIIFDMNGCSTGSGASFKCSSSLAGGLSSATITARNDSSYKVLATAWQINQSTNAVTAASLGAWSGAQGTANGGLGVTGAGDSYNGSIGAGGTHQIDNANGYTDMVLLQFNKAVNLSSATLALYGLTGVGADSDLSLFNASGVADTQGAAITAANWNSTINLASYSSYVPFLTWSNTDGGNTSGLRAVNSSGFSQVWLVGASTLTSDRDDGFKLSTLVVTNATPAVPEPGTWAMMIVGFGAVGATMRRRQRDGALAAA